MIDGYLVGTLALSYLAILFAIAWFGDFWLRAWHSSQGRPLIYALSIAIYCTSWSFFGSVVGIALMRIKGREWDHALPFGTFLALAAVIVDWGGPELLAWYWDFLGPGA